MATVVQICNMALTHIGRAPINTLSEASPEAREVNRHYTMARDSLMQMHPWKFLTRRRELARFNSDTEDNVVDDPDEFREPDTDEVRQVQGLWRYVYALPDGHLYTLSVNDHEMTYKYGAPYELMASKIYCNVEDAYLTYITRVTNTELYPPLFIDALAYGVAARIAYPLTREAKIRNDMIALYDRAMSVAMVQDMNQSENIVDHVSEFIDARDSSWSG